MKAFQTFDRFWFSHAGRRAAKRFRTVFDVAGFNGIRAAAIGSSAFFDGVFSKNRPDFVLRRDVPPDESPIFSLGEAQSLDAVFIAETNNAVYEKRDFLIKEAYRVLKPDGVFLLTIKNDAFFRFRINGVPQSKPSAVFRALSAHGGFSFSKRQNVLYLPFDGKIAETVDFVLTALNPTGGAFSVFTVRKEKLVPQSNKNYSAARITKASVFTSSRT